MAAFSVPPSSPLFSARDLRQLADWGISPEEAARQVEIFRRPRAPLRILRPCRLGDGIREISEAERPRLTALARQAAGAGRVSRFIPASGAATRMFKELLAFLNEGTEEPEVATFFAGLDRFAFAPALAQTLARSGRELARCLEAGAAGRREILGALLSSSGMGYADLPKGLLLFHRDASPGGAPRTAFEEHWAEAAVTEGGEDGEGAHGVACRLDFTVSPQHEAGFREVVERSAPRLAARFGSRFEITFSHQERSTDTLAVDLDNQPFRQADGTLLLRPGGHGALLRNLAARGREGA
ncbi:MAG TPA: DUF4301 family protein, partial [Thermoanaerobaculia bacterium]|nr:DUF4301 family protein [Thermoanaerobaculia bacterium]